MAYHTFHQVETRIVRIFNTYGPRIDLADGRVIPNFIQEVLQNKPLSIYGDGKQTRSYCYVSDLVDGILRMADGAGAAEQAADVVDAVAVQSAAYEPLIGVSATLQLEPVQSRHVHVQHDAAARLLVFMPPFRLPR